MESSHLRCCSCRRLSHLQSVIVGVCYNHTPITQPEHSQGMLQERVRARAILVTKAEQVLCKERVPTNVRLHADMEVEVLPRVYYLIPAILLCHARYRALMTRKSAAIPRMPG